MKESVYYLASEELEGRFPMTKGDTLACQYIANIFERNGLQPHFQEFPFNIVMAENNNGKMLKDSISGKSNNIFAILKGNDAKLRNEYVVVGAHFDHLGKNTYFSRSKNTENTHYGADDNASGVAILLEMVQKLVNEKSNHRSVIFIAFSCEEEGLVGSQYFTAHLPVAKEQVVAMVNFDMVGKFRNNTINVNGVGTSVEGEQIVDNIARMHNLQLKKSYSGMGPSDHASFYSKEIPVFFICTDPDTLYHTPYDSPETINYEGMDTIADFALALLHTLTTNDKCLTFQRSNDPEKSNPAKMKVSLGIMPDHSSTTEGVKVEIVSKGKAADKAGILAGDIITEINGTNINDLYEYMAALSTIEKGETIDVRIKRDGKELLIKVQTAK
jgi:hypothetical protein